MLGLLRAAPPPSILHACRLSRAARVGLPYEQQGWYNHSTPPAPRAAGQALQGVASLLPAIPGGAGAPGQRVSALPRCVPGHACAARHPAR
jgi:hypothetical protein